MDTRANSDGAATAPTVPASLNLNDFVWVKLRSKGKAILRARDEQWSRQYAVSFGRLATAEKQEADYEGWSRWQLWSLIEAFGPSLYLGCDPPFETTLRLQTPESAASDPARILNADKHPSIGSATERLSSSSPSRSDTP